MQCEVCKQPTTLKRHRFCSRECFYQSLRGVPNPSTRQRNLDNNPMRNPESVERMRKSLTGHKQSTATKRKRGESIKRFNSAHPEVVNRRLAILYEKHTQKVRGKGWRLARLKALERDKYTCQGCGATDKRLVVHHLDYRGRNLPSQRDMNNSLDNLVTWCDACHNGFHRHKGRDYHERMAKLGKRAA